MEEHCPQPGLPAREVIVAEALSQISQERILESAELTMLNSPNCGNDKKLGQPITVSSPN